MPFISTYSLPSTPLIVGYKSLKDFDLIKQINSEEHKLLAPSCDDENETQKL
jgi:hypothetical protein